MGVHESVLVCARVCVVGGGGGTRECMGVHECGLVRECVGDGQGRV